MDNNELIQQARELCDAATPVLVAEKKCVQKNIAGCNRDCGKCDLALPEDAIIAGFNAAIAVVGGCVPALIDQADQLVSENAALNSEFMHEKSVGVQDALDNAEVISFLKARAETAESELEQLRGVCDDLKIYGEKYVKIAEKRYEAFERAYARAEKAEAENRWIPVGERLPEHEREAVLAYQRDFNEAHIAWISGGYWEDTSGTFAPGKITHWRPLPEPPKGV